MKKYIRLFVIFAVIIMVFSACGSLTAEDTASDIQPDTQQDAQPADIAVNESGEAVFSCPGGLYAEPFVLKVSARNAVGIVYTIDGSDPRTSSSALSYTDGISITDGSERSNVVSAVPTVEICGSFNAPSSDKTQYVCTVSEPADDAVDKCTTVKAAALYADGSYSPVTTGTYFIGTASQHIQGLAQSTNASGSPLAVISITMDYADLFDRERGIYVKGALFEQDLQAYKNEHNNHVGDGEMARSLNANYKQRGKAWERPTHVEFFEFTPGGAELAFSQDCGIRIQGNYSRSDLQKGLRLVADGDYGDKRFRYAIFGDALTDCNGEVIDKFKSVVLRAGGNCAFTAKYNDTYWQSLAADLACDTKASRPCIVYINGEYWGLYVLEEDYSNYYFDSHYGVNKDDVVVYKGDAETYECGYKLDEGNLPDGVTEESFFYNALFGFFNTHHDISTDDAYEDFSKLVDVQSVMDYFAAEIWINNKWDWPGKNWSMWRTASIDPENPYADGRWRFSFYDVEFGGVSGKSDAYTNTIKEDNYKTLGLLDRDTSNPAVLCFAYLMTNEGFRNEFYEKLRGLSENEFEMETALARLDYFESVYGPLFSQFFERYPGTGSASNAIYGGYASSDCIRQFIMERSDHIESMIEWAEKQY